MVVPSIFTFTKVAADDNHIVGPLVVTFAVISLWEINRNVRLFNIITGLWLVLSPVILSFSGPAVKIDFISGIAVIVCSLYAGRKKKSFGGGWRSLFQKNPLHIQAIKSESFK